MSIYDDNLRPLKLDDVKTYPLTSRPSKVSLDDFASPVKDDASLKDFLAGLPNILAVQSLRELAGRMRRARELQKPSIWGMGGHVIKTGLGPVIIDLLKRGFVTAMAANGSVLVHDAEIAMVGSTSEDVDATLGEGAFGGAEETGQLLNRAAQEGAREGLGLGEATGCALLALNPKHADYSLLCSAYQSRVPFTVHLTIGGDITRSVFKGGYPCTQPRPWTYEHHHGQLRLHTILPAAHECSSPSHRKRRRARLLDYRSSRAHAAAPGCRTNLWVREVIGS